MSNEDREKLVEEEYKRFPMPGNQKPVYGTYIYTDGFDEHGVPNRDSYCYKRQDQFENYGIDEKKDDDKGKGYYWKRFLNLNDQCYEEEDRKKPRRALGVDLETGTFYSDYSWLKKTQKELEAAMKARIDAIRKEHMDARRRNNDGETTEGSIDSGTNS